VRTVYFSSDGEDEGDYEDYKDVYIEHATVVKNQLERRISAG